MSTKIDDKVKNIKKIKEIKKKLIDIGLTQAEIARELGVTRVVVNRVIHGKAKSKRVAKYLEKRLGVKFNEKFNNE